MIKYSILAVGKIKPSPELDLFNQYKSRLKQGIDIHEIADTNNQHERLLEKLESFILKGRQSIFVIGLDERGQNPDSIHLSEIIDEQKNRGVSHLIFIIGGADGLNEIIRNKCDYLLSFGRMTWPHMMVRAMLAEQIYRIQQISDNHPYHRA